MKIDINKPYSYGYAQKKYKTIKRFENTFNIILTQDNYYILRLDGVGMTKAFKIKKKAINELFDKTMQLTLNDLINEFPSIDFGYKFSDEISLLINTKNNFDKRLEKILSIFASKASLFFLKNAVKTKLGLLNKDWVFDCRIIELPNKEKVIEYFEARQAFAIDKFLMELKTEHSLDRLIHTSNEVINALKNEKQIEYKSIEEKYRNGAIGYRLDKKEAVVEGAKEFIKEREYLIDKFKDNNIHSAEKIFKKC